MIRIPSGILTRESKWNRRSCKSESTIKLAPVQGF